MVNIKKEGRKKAPPLNRENLIAAIADHMGNIANVARSFGVSRLTIYNHIGDDVELKRLLEESREQFIDFAEGALIRRIEADDTAAIIFALKTRGKQRGYVERSEHTGADGGPIQTETKVTVFSDMSDEELDGILARNPTSERGKGETDTSA